MTDLHYSDIELKASRMKNLGEDVINIQKSLSYYYYGGNKNKGQYSEEFEKMRNMVNSIVGDIGTFMTNYADIILLAAQKSEQLDQQLSAAVEEFMAN